MLIAWVGQTFAQPKLLQEEMYVGAHAGVIAGMYHFTPVVKQNWQQPFLGGNGGLMFRYIGHKVCGLQVELNYMQRGWNEPATDTHSRYTRTLDYIEVPFLMHLYFGKRARGYFNLGPQIGYCVRSNYAGDIPEQYLMLMQQGNTTSKNLHQYADVEKPFDWGLAAGLGFYYRTRRAGVYQLDVRFNYSFGNTFASTKMDYFDYSNPMALSLNLAYMWQIKGQK